jgi:3-hydroxybutyryl-CoA dehydratase
MLLGKKRKIGRHIEEISVGEKLTLTEKIEDKDLLLYLGLTNDANPLYIQHDYASQTPYEKPIVPTILLTGIVTAAVSKYLPGPGSHIVNQEISFLQPLYHYDVVQFLFEVGEVHPSQNKIVVDIHAVNSEEQTVLEGKITVCPPHKMTPMEGKALENF